MHSDVPVLLNKLLLGKNTIKLKHSSLWHFRNTLFSTANILLYLNDYFYILLLSFLYKPTVIKCMLNFHMLTVSSLKDKEALNIWTQLPCSNELWMSWEQKFRFCDEFVELAFGQEQLATLKQKSWVQNFGLI